jgi:hypothetical protein
VIENGTSGSTVKPYPGPPPTHTVFVPGMAATVTATGPTVAVTSQGIIPKKRIHHFHHLLPLACGEPNKNPHGPISQPGSSGEKMSGIPVGHRKSMPLGMPLVSQAKGL